MHGEITTDTGLAAQAAAIDALAVRLRRSGVQQIPEIVNAPERVSLHDLPARHDSAPVYGIDTRNFAPVVLPTRGLGVIAGPSGSGLSQAALTCVDALQRLDEGGISTALLTFSGSGLRNARAWDSVAVGDDEVRDLAGRLVTALGGKPLERRSGLLGEFVAAGDRSEENADAELPLEFPTAGCRGIIVVERPAEAERGEAIAMLTVLARTARRAEVLVLFEFEMGTAGAIWELYQVLRQPRWGLSLQPDEREAQSPFREELGRVTRAEFPPGRGFAVEEGRVTPVHVALAGVGEQVGNA